MAAIPPSFDPRGEQDEPRDPAFGEPVQADARQRRTGYVLVGTLVALLVVVGLLLVL